MPPRARIVIAMSGGVDSSTAAALLCAQGHDVVGVTLKLYDASGTAASIGGRCCSPRDIEDARATAAQLGIPHHVVDEVAAFRDAVIDDFVDAHRKGLTPNPCVRCNERIKFGPLLAFARAIGADALATGHYARVAAGADGSVHLRRAIDRDKDQSYFLFGVKPSILASVWFPLGELDKDAVRAHARRLRLPNADKPDSQEICFIPDGDHRTFVEKHGGAGKAGFVVDETGALLGAHEGTHLFTIGQRKGVPARDGQKRFVARIDGATGTVHTGPLTSVEVRHVVIESPRWLVPPRAGELLRAHVQIRHRAVARPATLAVPADDERADVVVTFDEPVVAATPGQAAVFYADDDRVLGGGWIKDAAVTAATHTAVSATTSARVTPARA